MSRARPATPRSQKILERVYMALGANKIHERWIDDKHGTLGLQEPGVITISPMSLVPVIIHECLHAAHPRWAEDTIARVTSYTYWRMSDDDAKRLYAAYASRVKRMKRPTTAE